MNDQKAKSDGGKLRLTLVPPEIIEDIAVTRQYGDMKYGSTDNWKEVEIERYRDALCRHLIAYLREPWGRDVESNLPHLFHLVCNGAFLCALETEAGTIPDAQTALSQMRRPEAPRTDGTETLEKTCATCIHNHYSDLDGPCGECRLHTDLPLWRDRYGG